LRHGSQVHEACTVMIDDWLTIVDEGRTCRAAMFNGDIVDFA
jgi:hypothetical protein